MTKILGLDLGTASVGWSLIAEQDGTPERIIGMGVRIFSEVTDAKTKTPKNQKRQTKRGLRRQIERRSRRRKRAAGILFRAGLLPVSPEDSSSWEDWNHNVGNPYDLRSKGLDNTLAKEEFAKVMLHFAKRRGFKSNRKLQGKDDGVVKESIAQLRVDMESENCRTLGEYLQRQPKKRSRYVHRDMYEEEFEALWSAQAPTDPSTYTEELKQSLHEAIFFQRPLKSQKHLIGKCPLETNRRRCPKAYLAFQRFRLLADLVNLQVKDPLTGDFESLSMEQRNNLAAELSVKEKLTWTGTRRILGLQDRETINLEEGGKKHLQGNVTAFRLRKAMGAPLWDGLSDEQQEDLVTDLSTIEGEESLKRRLGEGWEFDEAVVEALSAVTLENGFGNYSNKALRKLIPELENGKNLWEARVAAGYEDEQNAQALDALPLPQNIRNPVVKKALHEVRKVVNAIIREYGKPDVVRIEMARDLKQSRSQREDYQKIIYKRAKKNEEVRETLSSEFSIPNPSRDDVQKYLLWEECKEECPYSGQSISRSMLFAGPVEVEHILPYSISLDDSFANKTLCIREWNEEKGNRTPYEAFGESKDWEDMLQRVRTSTMSFSKRRRFETKEYEAGEFATRQLNDTRYICKEVASYIGAIGVRIGVSRGSLTAAIRHQWQLNRLLNVRNVKNRDDHRHHAVDALLTAIISPGLLQKVSHLSQRLRGASLNNRLFKLPRPWESFDADVRASVDAIIVSHAESNGITGAFHEDTAFGKRQDGTYAVRKKLEDLSEKEVTTKVRDQAVKEILLKRIVECGGNLEKGELKKSDLKKAFAEPVYHKDGVTPIKTVRLEIIKGDGSMFPVLRDGQPYKYHLLGNNHHVEIFKDGIGRWYGKMVSAFDAATRARNEGTEIVQKEDSAGRFVMSLCKNQMLEITDEEKGGVYYVQNFSGSILLRKHHYAKEFKDKETFLYKTVSALAHLNFRKVFVDPLGRIHPRND